jgi:hypothetical protein
MMILMMMMQFATDATAATTELLRTEIRRRKGTRMPLLKRRRLLTFRKSRMIGGNTKIGKEDRAPEVSRKINNGKAVTQTSKTETTERSTQTEPTESITTEPIHLNNHQLKEKEKKRMTGMDTTPPVIRFGAIMPCPEQRGALSFDGNGITEFLRRWNLECQDFGLTDAQKCERIPYYCSEEIKELIKFLDGYTTTDWALLQKELKEMYWQNDKQRDSTVSLNTLISNAGRWTFTFSSSSIRRFPVLLSNSVQCRHWTESIGSSMDYRSHSATESWSFVPRKDGG